MADIIIPGTDKILLDGTIVILADFDNVRYILHNGYYTYNNEMFEGWYGVSIPDQNIIPIVVDMLVGCEIVYYPNSNCSCKFPNGNIPYTTYDEFQLQRAFITVDTMIERDALSPNLSITDLANGKIVRVNKPNNVDFDPKYYIYTYNRDLSGAYWDSFIFYNFPEGGIPKSDLSEGVQQSLDLADSSVQFEDFNSDFEINYENDTISLSEYGKVYTCVLNWLSKIHTSDTYDPEQVESNLLRLATIRNLDSIYQTYWGRNLVYINVSGKYHPAIVVRDGNNNIVRIQTFVYVENIQQLVLYTIQGTTLNNYTQTQTSMLQYNAFDEYSNQGASQYVIAQWIYSLMGVADGIAGLDSNGLINSSVLPVASSVNLGAIKINQGGLEIANDGTVSIIPGTNIEIDQTTGAINNTYELPIASANLLGGIKAGTWISIDQNTGAASVVIPASTFDSYGAAAAVQSNLDIEAGKISTIEGLIPNTASSENQLADKNFVNSSIATNTAYFIGTFDSVEELEAYSGTVTNNDYAFVVEYDSQGQAVAYNRYKYNADTQEWLYEYTLNNSSFTAEQWAAINSAITADLVTSYSDHIADTTIHVTSSDKSTWNAKYVKPSGGIPKSDLAQAVQTSLGLADTALQSAPVTSVNTKTGAVTLTASDVGAYVKPASGIPASDLASDVDLVPDASSATDGQLLTADGTGGYDWEDAPVSLPSGGTSGQVLTKQSNADGDVDWDNIPTIAPIVGELTLLANAWTTLDNVTYTQPVTIPASNTNSKVDLQPDATVLNLMVDLGVNSLYIQNNNGTLSAVAIGAEPDQNITVQYSMVITVSADTIGAVDLNDVYQTTGDILILNGGTSTTNLADPYPNGNGQSF